MKNFTNDLKITIIERLNDYEGATSYGCDLSYLLFERENTDGSVLCNTYETKEFIKENFDLFGELVEYVSTNMGENLNPFSEPEKAHVYLILDASQTILSRLKTIDKNWNDEIELTPKMIKKLTKELNELNINEADLF